MSAAGPLAPICLVTAGGYGRGWRERGRGKAQWGSEARFAPKLDLPRRLIHADGPGHLLQRHPCLVRAARLGIGPGPATPGEARPGRLTPAQEYIQAAPD